MFKSITNLRQVCIFLPCLVFCSRILSAQELRLAVRNAYTITRLAEKFHVQPRLLNRDFSADVFTQVLRQLDPDKVFFTAGDIKELSKFQFDIAGEIQHQQANFVTAMAATFANRVYLVDTMIDHICKNRFDFTLAESLTAREDTSYPVDSKARREKLVKLLKLETLEIITGDDRLLSLSPNERRKYADSVEPSARHKAQDAFKHTINLVLQNAGGVEKSVGDEYCKAIAVCYDPHSEYLPLTEKENFDSELGQQQMVFGFKCAEEDDGSVKIENIMPGSPAFKSGQMNKGDKIISIQWENKAPIDVSSGGLKQLYEVLDMSNHDRATFKLQKPDGTQRIVILMKQKMDYDDDANKVKSFLLKGSKTVGFISLPAFYQDWDNAVTGVNGCANDVAKEILKLKNENMEGLIIDLRYNGGGSLQEAVDLAGLFIDFGPVGMARDKDGKMYTLRDVNRGTVYDGPLMLMVNGYSASASEVFAGTLQDYHRAVIVGTPTYGKATAQVVLPMDTAVDIDKNFSEIKTDSYFKVTVSKLYRVTGNSAQAVGVQPDILLPDLLDVHAQREADNDHVLLAPAVAANKYFKPYPPINFEPLKQAGQQQMAASSYFQQLNRYLQMTKTEGDPKTISLQLSVAIEEEKLAVKNEIIPDTTVAGKVPYGIDNNVLEKEQLQLNTDLKDANDQWINFLRKDAYLQISYEMILLMIK